MLDSISRETCTRTLDLALPHSLGNLDVFGRFTYLQPCQRGS